MMMVLINPSIQCRSSYRHSYRRSPNEKAAQTGLDSLNGHMSNEAIERYFAAFPALERPRSGGDNGTVLSSEQLITERIIDPVIDFKPDVLHDSTKASSPDLNQNVLTKPRKGRHRAQSHLSLIKKEFNTHKKTNSTISELNGLTKNKKETVVCEKHRGHQKKQPQQTFRDPKPWKSLADIDDYSARPLSKADSLPGLHFTANTWLSLKDEELDALFAVDAVEDSQSVVTPFNIWSDSTASVCCHTLCAWSDVSCKCRPVVTEPAWNISCHCTPAVELRHGNSSWDGYQNSLNPIRETTNCWHDTGSSAVAKHIHTTPDKTEDKYVAEPFPDCDSDFEDVCDRLASVLYCEDIGTAEESKIMKYFRSDPIVHMIKTSKLVVDESQNYPNCNHPSDCFEIVLESENIFASSAKHKSKSLLDFDWAKYPRLPLFITESTQPVPESRDCAITCLCEYCSMRRLRKACSLCGALY